ncbi:hypothetical protein BH23ACT10_BH23ACT10_36830 [soil metagenome]
MYSPGTGEAIPSRAQTVDAALALNVMHHLDDVEQTAVELARVLKPGRRLLLIDEDFGHPNAGSANTTTRHRSVGNQPAYIVTATNGSPRSGPRHRNLSR